MFTRITLAAAAAALLLAGGSATAQDALKARKDGFKASKEAMAQIKTLLEKDQVAEVGAVAGRLGDYAAQVPTLFPAGSDKGETKAKADIWSNTPDFTAKAKDFEAAAKALQTTAAAGDKAAAMKQFAALGGACKSCHDRYRSE